MAVIAALHDPLTVLVRDDLADVVTPDDDGADGRSACIRSIVRPGTGEIVGRAGIAADLAAHIPSAPRTRPAGIAGMGVMVVTTATGVVVMPMVRPSLGARSKQTKHCRCSHERTLHGYSLLEGRSRFRDQGAAYGRALKSAGRRGSNGAGSIPLRAFKKPLVTKM